MQIKYRQRWAASFRDWFNWVSQLKVKVFLSSNFVGLSELSLHFHSPVTLAQLIEGGPYHPSLWQRQCKEDSSCGTCGKTRSGVIGVIEALAIVGVVGTIKKVGGGAGEGIKKPDGVQGRAQRLPPL